MSMLFKELKQNEKEGQRLCSVLIGTLPFWEGALIHQRERQSCILDCRWQSYSPSVSSLTGHWGVSVKLAERFSQTRRAFQSNSQSVYVKPSRLYSAEMLSLQCSDALSTVQRCCLYSAVTLSLKGAAAGADFPNR
jgi:hypothetical protein